MIIFKTPELRREFIQLCPETEIIVFSIAGFLQIEFNLDLIVTSIFRPEEPLHGDWRALDFRIQQKGADPYIDLKQQSLLKTYTSLRFSYDKSRPRLKVLVIHENRINGRRGGPKDGTHGHIQSYPGKTEIKK